MTAAPLDTREISRRLELPPPGSERVWPFPVPNNPNAFLSGDPESDRVRIRYYRPTALIPGEHAELWGRAWFGPRSEGPPGLAHGGSQASLLDESMGGCAWMNALPVVAAKFTVDLIAPLPLGSFVLFHAKISRVEGRKVFATAELLSEDSTRAYCRGEGLFIVIDPSTYLPRRT